MSLKPDIERVLLPMVRYCQSMAITAQARGWNDRPWLDLIINLEAAPDHLAALLGQHVEAAKREAWDEACKAIAWCLENGPMERALPYVAEHNPYRAGGGAAGGGESCDTCFYEAGVNECVECGQPAPLKLSHRDSAALIERLTLRNDLTAFLAELPDDVFSENTQRLVREWADEWRTR